MEQKITVIMTVYNGEKYIKEAIDSILRQTYKNFELLIINDGSTDNTLKIVNQYQDKRLKLIQNPINSGIVYSRNKALEESTGEFIAVLDADDIALPTRLKKQLNFLEKNTDFGLIGGWAELIDEYGNLTGIKWKNKIPPNRISSTLLFNNLFTHSAAMLRKNAIPADGYRQYEISCEFDLWIRMAKKWKLGNLNEILVKYRIHSEGVSKNKKETLDQELKQIYTSQLSCLDIRPSDEELKIHRTNFTFQGKNIKEFIDKREAWLEKLNKANNEVGYYPKHEFAEVISERWLYSCDSNSVAGFWIWKKFWHSPLSKQIHWSDWNRLLKFFIKCLLKKNKFN